MTKPPSPERVRLEAEAARFLVERHREEIAGDYEVQLSIVEGETTLLELLQSLFDEIDDDKSLIAGLESRVKEYLARKKRLEARVEKRRELIARAMEIAGLDKASFPNGSLHTRPKGQEIDDNTLDEPLIPWEFWIPSRRLDRTKLKNALLSGQDIPGARLNNGGGLILTIRRS